MGRKGEELENKLSLYSGKHIIYIYIFQKDTHNKYVVKQNDEYLL